MIHLDRKLCADPEEAHAREWLETNGGGGFASSTITGLNARRYHGLLVAATKPPAGRFVLLSKLEETLIIDGRRYDLSTNQYPGLLHPQGYRYQTGFRLDPFPVFTYKVAGVLLEKSVFMVAGENSTVIRYDIRRADETENDQDKASLISHPATLILLELRPLVAFRDYHSLAHENSAFNPRVETKHERLIRVAPSAEMPALYFAHDADETDTNAAGYWYRNFVYERERERGFDFKEDLFNPLLFKFDLSQRAQANVIASTAAPDVARADELRQTEIARRAAVVSQTESLIALTDSTLEQAHVGPEFVGALVAAADQFIVARGSGQTVIAGYQWFGDWGRDTMIALPGLTLATGRAGVARSILSEFARHVSQGMLPNRFPDAGESPDYNTVDATLWYFEAVRALLRYTNDFAFVRVNLYEVLSDIIAWHVRGTRFRIRVDVDGLLDAGEAGAQLTWMDAKVGEWVVTPRRGKPVEIQALWYNALRVMEELAQEFADAAARLRYAEMAERARASFQRLFWNEQAGCLYDVIDGETRDASIRPNQILSISLTHPILADDKARQVLAVVERELLTPYGLRSLAPSDPHYRGRYEGDPLSRDGAYHQGTVWAWLMGPFVSAYVKAHGHSRESRVRAARWLKNFATHLNEAGLGQVSEIFDGDPPHTPRGCIAQAWSVGELLRAALEDVNDVRTVSIKLD